MEGLAREGVLTTGFFQVITLQLLAAGGHVRVVESRKARDGVGVKHGFDIKDDRDFGTAWPECYTLGTAPGP